MRSVETADGDKAFDWGSTIFSEPISEAWDTIKFVTNHAKSLAVFRSLANDPATWSGMDCPTACESLKYCETRFASKLLMLDRYRSLRQALEMSVMNSEY